MRLTLLLAGVAFLLAVGAHAQPAPAAAPAVVPERTIPLFNGRDLSGWKADVPAATPTPPRPTASLSATGCWSAWASRAAIC